MTGDPTLWAAIVDRVLRFTRVSASAFAARGANSTDAVEHARMLADYLAAVEFDLGPAEVSRLNGRDKATVGVAINIIEDRRDDAALDAAIDAMATELRRRFPLTPPIAANDNQVAA